MATVQIKHSAVSGHVPSSLLVGEIAINEADRKIFYRDGSGVVQVFDLPPRIQQNQKSANYTLIASDAGKHILHPSSDTTARTWTIPSNASVPYDIGTPVTFINQNGAGIITIAITSDTMRLAGAGTTGSRILAVNGIATAIKIATTEWLISGMGLT